MGVVLTLLKYKLLHFFGPSVRGKWGPGPLLLLELIFAGYGFGAGYGVGTLINTGTGDSTIEILGGVMSGLLSVGFLYSLGPGFTASPSELDFVLTTQIRPRQFLVSDMVFQFFSLGISGGLAGLLALFGIVTAMGKSLALLPWMLIVLLAYVFMVLMIVQILVVLRIRFTGAEIRIWTLVLLFLSLLPAVPLAAPSFPLHFHGLPVPPSIYADLMNDILVGQTPALATLAAAMAYPLAIAAIWLALSTTYIFHGVQPTLSAGLGQINFSARQAQQRRLITGLGGLTTRFTLRTDQGSDLGFMTRFHVVRVLRDGSLLFIGLIVTISIVPNALSGGSASQNGTAGLSQIMTLPLALLALNWGYYESTNLWLVASAGKSLINYFRGMMLGFASVVIVIAVALTTILMVLSGKEPDVSDFTFPIISPVAASVAATALLTRLKINPGAFSAAIFAIILVTVFSGIVGGYVAAYAVALAGAGTTLAGEFLQALALAGFTVLLGAFGLLIVGALARGFVVRE